MLVFCCTYCKFSDALEDCGNAVVKLLKILYSVSKV